MYFSYPGTVRILEHQSKGNLEPRTSLEGFLREDNVLHHGFPIIGFYIQSRPPRKSRTQSGMILSGFTLRIVTNSVYTSINYNSRKHFADKIEMDYHMDLFHVYVCIVSLIFQKINRNITIYENSRKHKKILDTLNFLLTKLFD